MDQCEKKPEGGLLQSSEWMAVLRAEGHYVVDVHDDREVLYGVEHALPFVGRYLYVPRIHTITRDLLDNVCALPYAWIRVDVDNEEVLGMLHSSSRVVVRAPHDMQPRSNLIIDLAQSEDDLLRGMKAKTRYNIKLAEKKNVQITVSRDQSDVVHLHKLVKMTETRKRVTFHAREHYERIVESLPSDMVSLYIARYNDEVIAVNLMAYCQKTAIYLHGATSDKHRDVMAPYLLQWQAMQDAKRSGCLWYDLGGVFPQSEDPGKNGITRFKRGFAPYEAFYDTQGSFDIILSRWRYDLYRALRVLRW